MSKESNENAIPSNDRLEAVRELLFGQNVQEYRGDIKEVRDLIDKNTEQLRSESSELESKLLKRIDELESSLTKMLGEMRSELDAKIDQLQNDKVDRKQLAKLLSTIANELDS